eukprot:1209601-Rhodomonas_salina.3
MVRFLPPWCTRPVTPSAPPHPLFTSRPPTVAETEVNCEKEDGGRRGGRRTRCACREPLASSSASPTPPSG